MSPAWAARLAAPPARIVDCANASEGEFLKPKPVSQIAGRHRFKVKVASGGVDESEQLRVIEEDIDVMAFAMANLDHRRSGAK